MGQTSRGLGLPAMESSIHRLGLNKVECRRSGYFCFSRVLMRALQHLAVEMNIVARGNAASVCQCQVNRLVPRNYNDAQTSATAEHRPHRAMIADQPRD